MLENNNKSVINKLSKRILRENKLRNLFAILAIALTTVLITTTIVGAITFYNTNKTYMNVSNTGVDSDGYINVDKSSLEKINNISNIDKKAIAQLASEESIKNPSIVNELVMLQSVNKVAYDMMAIVPIEGSYPKKEDEVLVPTWVLDVLGIEKKLNERINLDVVIDGEVKNLSLKVCGYYESLVSRGNGKTRIFVSNEFIKTYNPKIEDVRGTKTVFLTLKNVKNNFTFDQVNKEFEKIATEIGAEKFKAHPKYNIEASVLDKDTVVQLLAVAFAIILVIITGYLIIYNIFYISVSRDIKFYGLLKTIGTTEKQLKKIILKQALRLSCIGIPIGVVLGYIISVLILPFGMSFTIFGNIVVVSNSPLIFILSILFSLITVFISCNKPGKIAGKVSPIEAVRFVSEDIISKNKNKKGLNGGKIHKMAWSNIIKSKRKVILSVLSISLSGVIVIFTMCATFGINPEAHAENQMTSDISVSNEISHFLDAEYRAIDDDIIDKIKSLPIVKDVDIKYSAIEKSKYDSILDFGVDISLEGKLLEEIKAGEKSGSSNIRKLILSNDIVRTEITALNADKINKEIENLEIIDGKIDIDEFKKGGYLIYYIGSGEVQTIKAGDIIPLTFSIEDENKELKSISKNFKVMAIVADRSGGWSASNLSTFNIEENEFKSIFKNYKNSIKKIDIDLKDNVDLILADKQINKIINESNIPTLMLTSKNFYIDSMEEMKVIMLVVGGVVGFILALIGIINVANTIFTSVLARRVELAMLESIGMTKKQIRKMLFSEGLYYLLLTSLIIIPLGAIAGGLTTVIIPIYGGFNFIVYFISTLVVIFVIAILMMIIPLISYKFISKESIVDRLKVVE